MQVRFSPPPYTESPLARLDARWRLAALLAAMLCVCLLRTLWTALPAFLAVLLLALLARLPWRWYLQRLSILAVPLAFFILPMPFLSRAGWQEGARLALLFLLEAMTLTTLAVILLVSAPLETTLKAAHSLRVPGLLIHLALLSYRYLFVLGEELARLRVALRVRGFRNRSNLHSYHTVSQVAGTLLVRGYERAERVAQAMRCRGFDGRFRSLTTFRTRWVDVLALLLIAACGAGLVWLDLLLR